jgi:hypothetical protein
VDGDFATVEVVTDFTAAPGPASICLFTLGMLRAIAAKRQVRSK